MALVAVVWVALQGTSVQTRHRGGTAQTDKVQPVNSGATSLQRDSRLGTAQCRGTSVGRIHGVAIDRDARRSGLRPLPAGHPSGCLGTRANPVHHFDESGKEIRALAAGCSCGRTASMSIGRKRVGDRRPGGERRGAQEVPGEDRKGNVVVKCRPEGTILMTLGKPGVRGTRPMPARSGSAGLWHRIRSPRARASQGPWCQPASTNQAGGAPGDGGAIVRTFPRRKSRKGRRQPWKRRKLRNFLYSASPTWKSRAVAL